MTVLFRTIIIVVVVINYSYFYFPPTTLTCHPTPTSHPQSYPSLSVSMGLSTGSLITLPFLSCIISHPLHSGYCQVYFISMSLFIFWGFFCSVDQIPLKGEILWYLSFTSWLISLSIMLNSSIHAVTKGKSSFFLYAVQYSII